MIPHMVARSCKTEIFVLNDFTLAKSFATSNMKRVLELITLSFCDKTRVISFQCSNYYHITCVYTRCQFNVITASLVSFSCRNVTGSLS